MVILEELKKDAYLNMCKGEEKDAIWMLKTLENKCRSAKARENCQSGCMRYKIG